MSTESDISLRFEMTRALRRCLTVTAQAHRGTVSAAVYLGRAAQKMVAYAIGNLSDSRLNVTKRVLWLERAAFDLTEAETEKIRETFEPLGLRIESESSHPVASSLSDGKSKEAPASRACDAGRLLPHGGTL